MLSFKQKRAFKIQLKSYFIASPCSMKWEDMTGNEAVRFCGDCKLNVHNLSALPDEQVAELINKKADGERICTYFYRKDDGTIATDNCPKELKQVRNRLQAYALSMAIALSWTLATSADAQGLVGPPVDPRYTDSATQLADVGYDHARDIARMVTAVSVVLFCLFGWLRSKKVKRVQLARELIAFSLIPIFIYFAGLFAANSFAAPLGGGF